MIRMKCVLHYKIKTVSLSKWNSLLKNNYFNSMILDSDARFCSTNSTISSSTTKSIDKKIWPEAFTKNKYFFLIITLKTLEECSKIYMIPKYIWWNVNDKNSFEIFTKLYKVTINYFDMLAKRL